MATLYLMCCTWSLRPPFSLNDEWIRACGVMVGRLEALGVPVILHKAWWAEKFYNHSTGTVEVFDDDQLKIVRKYNDLLSCYYDKICGLYPDLRVVEVGSDLVYSDFAHKWGRDYFHYSQEYYKSLASLISDALGDPCG